MFSRMIIFLDEIVCKKMESILFYLICIDLDKVNSSKLSDIYL